MESADAFTVRLELAELVAVEQAEPFDAIGDAALVQLVQAWNLVWRGCHNQLAALLVRYSVLRTETLHGGATSYTIAGFQRAGAVINSGVDNTAVMARLMGGDAVLFFHNEQAFTRKAAGEFEGCCQPNDAGADDEEICVAFSHEGLAKRTDDYTSRIPSHV